MKPEEKWNGTVIEVLDREHGKKVIEWWKEQGVDTVYEGDGVGDCYGIYNGKFNHYSKKYALAKGKKIITIPFVFPEKWYLPITEENQEMANEWRMGKATRYKSKIIGSSTILFSDFIIQGRSDGSCFCDKWWFQENVEEFIEYSLITTQQFIDNVYNPWKKGQKIIQESKQKQENMKRITYLQAQEIIDMVSPSCKWKERLLDLWAINIVLKQGIEVSGELLQEGRKEASTSQKEVLDRIFGKEKEEIELSSGQGLNGKELFNKGLNTGARFLISIYGGKGKSFYLHNNFKWTLTGNVLTVSHKDV